jgi:DNA repair protein RecO (recombination protein O)
MNRTYQVTGINLKHQPLGESDRLLTVLTPELGLLRVVAKGARKTKSKLGGRTSLFVINDLTLSRGRSLDRIIHAETRESYPKLSRDLAKLTAAQYLAELVLLQALGDQPQAELYYLLCEHLHRLEGLTNEGNYEYILPHLSHGIFHLLALAGIAPQVHACCASRSPLIPDLSQPEWQVGFNIAAGGTISLGELQRWQTEGTPQGEALSGTARLNAIELTLLQQLSQPQLSPIAPTLPQDVAISSLEAAWTAIERLLRQYAQYHFGRTIRSAALIDSYFYSLPTLSPTL